MIRAGPQKYLSTKLKLQRNGPILCTISTDRLYEMQTRGRDGGDKKSQITADVLNGSPSIGTIVQEI